MAISFVSAAGGNFSATRSPASVAEGAGVSDGDILLVSFTADSLFTADGTPPTGWTLIVQQDATTDSSTVVYWKRRSGAESATWTNIFAGNETGRWIMLAYNGCVASGNPVEDFDSTGSGASEATVTCSTTPTTNGAWVVAIVGCDPGSDPYTFAWDSPSPTGQTTVQRIDSDTTPTGQNATNSYTSVADAAVPTAGAVTLQGTSSNSDVWAKIGIALKPAAGGTSHTVDPADSVSLSDSLTRAMAYGRTQQDGVNLADQALDSQGLRVGDTLALADQLARVVAIVRALADSVTLADDVDADITTGAVDYERDIDDLLALADALTKGYGKGLADSVSLTDSLSSVSGLGVSISDSVSVADLFSRLVTYTRTPADSLALADLLSTAHPQTLALADLVAITDAQNIVNGIITILLDPIYTGHIGYGEQGEISDTVGGIVEVEEVVEV